MRILICDDLKSETDRLETVLKNSGYELNIATFHNGYDVLDYIRSGAIVDICFLDIIMPEITGIKLAEELRADGFKGDIIFLSTSKEYGPESYIVNAFSYLLKPPNPEKVRDILFRLERQKKKDDSEGILIKVSKIARHMLFCDISYIEVIKHYVYFHLTDGEEIEIYATFKEIASQLLNDSRFTQCHRSYIVNMNDIKEINEREITMRSGRKIPYSKSYFEIKKKFAKWIVKEE